MKTAIAIFLLLLQLSVNAQKKYYMLVGTYTNERSHGIYVYDYNSKEGKAVLVDSAAASQPSFLAVSPDRKFVYAVNEDKDSGAVSSFSFNGKTGHMIQMAKQFTGGDHPCYVAVDKKGKWVVAGNYTGGSVSLFATNPKTGLSPLQSKVVHSGHGLKLARQASPHVHATVFSPDNKYVFVPDLGIDKVMVYQLHPQKGFIPGKPVPVRDGSGPRHLEFHPNAKWAYLVQELSGTITAYSYKEGQLKEMQTTSLLPDDYHDAATSADIHVSPDGKFLYASNRDVSNTIAIFKIDQLKGTLTLVGHQSTLGRTPRNFSFDPSGNYLIVANQNSDNIIIFTIDRKTGLLKDSGNRVNVSKPVCIKWIPKS